MRNRKHPERPLVWKANKILKMGSRGLQQAAPQAVGAEERRGEKRLCGQCREQTGSGSMSQALAIPEINREYLERGKAVSQAGGGLCQHNLYFQAGDI